MSSIEPKVSQSGVQVSDHIVAEHAAVEEQRKETRTAIPAPATVVFYDSLDDDFYDHPSTTVNTSRNGMCIETPLRLDKGHPVLIRVAWNNLYAIDSAQYTAYHGEVRWCSRYRTILGNTTYRTGIRFYEPSERGRH